MPQAASGLCVACLAAILMLNWTASRVAKAHSEEDVRIEQHEADAVVRIGGQEFTVLHFGDAVPKPYFLSVKASDGAILTRPIDPSEHDHPHHKGIWLSVDEVNGVKFWAELGKIATKNITSVSGNPGKIFLENEWLNSDGKLILLEKTVISIHANRLIAYDIELSRPKGTSVMFGDTKEGFFGIRIAQSMREKEGGTVCNSEGQISTQNCWGQTAKWVDYTGPIDGKLYGVTIMDHPANFRPARFHVRDYGLFSISPFGEGAYQNDLDKAKPVTLDDSRPSLRMRYGLFIHDGAATVSDLTKIRDQYLASTK